MPCVPRYTNLVMELREVSYDSLELFPHACPYNRVARPLAYDLSKGVR